MTSNTVIGILKLKKMAARLMFACFMVISIGTIALIIDNADHHCTGEHCDGCAIILVSVQILNLIDASEIVQTISSVAVIFFITFVLYFSTLYKTNSTLINLKVQMNS